MQWLNQFLRPQGGSIGIELHVDSMRVAVRGADGQAIHSAAVLQTDSEKPTMADWTALMQAYVEKHRLQKHACNVVLSPQDYQLMLVEAPDVPDAEMREAVKWRVKDLISTPIDASVIEIFALPDDASKAGKSMLYVVIADLAHVQSVIDMTQQCGLNLNSIDIEVLALRNLLQLKALERAAAIVRLKSGSGDVSIYRDGNLYLSRHFQLNYSGGLLDELPSESLALEVQRSFDYFERQMGQVPPSVLFICGEGVGPEKIDDELRRGMSAPVEFLDLNEISMGSEDIDEGIIQLCLGAIGATYREEAA